MKKNIAVIEIDESDEDRPQDAVDVATWLACDRSVRDVVVYESVTDLKMDARDWVFNMDTSRPLHDPTL